MISTAWPRSSSSRLSPNTTSPSPPACATGAHSEATITTNTAKPHPTRQFRVAEDRPVCPAVGSPEQNETVVLQVLGRGLTSVPSSLRRVRSTAPDRPPTLPARPRPRQGARLTRRHGSRPERDERRATVGRSNPSRHPREVVARKQFITFDPQRLPEHPTCAGARDRRCERRNLSCARGSWEDWHAKVRLVPDVQ